MVNMYQLLIMRYSMAGDGEPAEKWTVDSITSCNLEIMVESWQVYVHTHNLRKQAGKIQFVSAEELSTIRLVLFKVFI